MVAVVGSCVYTLVYPLSRKRENQNRPQKLVFPACASWKNVLHMVRVCVGTYARVTRAALTQPVLQDSLAVFVYYIEATVLQENILLFA